MPTWHHQYIPISCICQLGIMEYIPTWQYHKKMTRTPYPSEVQDRFIVRFPEGMRDKIAEIAKSNGRSMNAEIIARLEQSFSASNQFDEAAVKEIIDRTIDATLRSISDFDSSYKKSIFKTNQDDLKKD